MLKEIIAVTNDKGGVGKTTTAQNLAMGLTIKGFKVLIIDADSQRYASFCNGWHQLENKGRTLFDALKDVKGLPVYKSETGIYYTPSSEQINGIEPYLSQQMSPNQVLCFVFDEPIDKHYDEPLNTVHDFDYIIIDCPPSMGSITLNAMSVASGLLIPIQLESFAVRGLANVTAKFLEVKKTINKELTIRGFLLVMVDERLSTAKVYSKDLNESFDIFNTRIRRNNKIVESQEYDGNILSYAPTSNGAKDYMAFVEEFLATSPEPLNS